MVVTAAHEDTRAGLTEDGRGLPPGYYCPPVHSPLSAAALARAVRTASGGSAPDALSRYLCERFAATDATLFDSGTHALTAAIRAARQVAGANAPVALPAFTCYDVATAAVGADAAVLLYDIDPDTLGPDWTSFGAALESGAGVAVIAPMYGYPVDWSRAREAAARHGTFLIEDAAQAAGAEWNGTPVGSLGDLSVLSFGRGKGWTGAGGGAVLTRGTTCVEVPAPAPALGQARVLALAGAQLVLSHPLAYGIPARAPFLHLGETRYHPPSEAAAISPLSAALVLETADAAIHEARQRRVRATVLEQSVHQGGAIERIETVPNGAPGFLRFPLRMRDGAARAAFLNRGRRHGVSGTYPTPLTALQPLQERLIRPAARFSGAETLARELITLPLHEHSRRGQPELERWLRDVSRMAHPVSSG